MIDLNLVKGGKKSGPGSYQLDDVEMCYDADKRKKDGTIKKVYGERPCDCKC